MFYVTTSANHPTGAGYFEIHTNDRKVASKACYERLGDKWCFIYPSLDKIHPLDKQKLGDIYPSVIHSDID